MQVRAIAMDGLVWGASKIEPMAFGINKLQICAVVEDDKVASFIDLFMFDSHDGHAPG